MENGKPGNMPFFSNILKDKKDPIRTPTMPLKLAKNPKKINAWAASIE